jgi:alpha-beta hydrolase superfamily lysophospholipase
MVTSALRLVRRLAASAALGLVLIGTGVWLYFALNGPEPQPWHRVELKEEFTAADADRVKNLADYRRLEDRLFEELRRQVYAKVVPGNLAPFNRYAVGSRSDPGVWPINWNRTFEIAPEHPVGGVLLLHGLTDSPYSLRSIGENLGAHGFHVVGLRLPGHGTAPSGLLTFEVEDLEAAVRLAMRDLRARLGPRAPIYIVGYSNGAALAVSYSLSILEGEDLPRPAGLVLISPAIAISPLAIVGRIRTGISELPGFARAAWQVISAEVDPYKYQSFSFHAAGETDRLTRVLGHRIARLAEAGPIKGFPPVLAFVSTVDSTVKAGAVVDVLLGRLAPGGSELVLFDVNRYAVVQQLLVSDPGPLTQRLLQAPRRPYALTVITNVDPGTQQVQELRAEPGTGQQTARPLEFEWPAGVFSLSHVALPFPPDDPLYGYQPGEKTNHVQLGRIEAHGENGVLKVPGWMLTRQRSNPFHAYLLQRVDEFVAPAGPAT